MHLHWRTDDTTAPTFNVFDKNGSVITISGHYLLCDGGYNKWKCLQCPLKFASDMESRRWSCWLESLRKDVECTFGILKGRFRILKSGIRMQKKIMIHKTFVTCCVLHNMLLSYDGLDKSWEGTNSLHDEEEISRIFRRAETAQSTTDMTSIGQSRRYRAINSEDDTVPIETEIGHDDLQNILIEHFNYKFSRKELHWPKRNVPEEIVRF